MFIIYVSHIVRVSYVFSASFSPVKCRQLLRDEEKKFFCKIIMLEQFYNFYAPKHRGNIQIRQFTKSLDLGALQLMHESSHAIEISRSKSCHAHWI